MLSCKQVATMASDYLDKNTDAKLQWKIRLHLMVCANCRRFIRHLKITQQVAPGMAQQSAEVNTVEVDAEQILKRVRDTLDKNG